MILFYIVITQLVLLYVGIPLYSSSISNTSVSLNLNSILISFIPPIFIFIFTTIKKKFILKCIPFTLGFSSVIYYLRFSFADEFLLFPLLLALLLYIKPRKCIDYSNNNMLASRTYSVLLKLYLFSAAIGITYKDIRIIKSIIFVIIINLMWTQRNKIYEIILNGYSCIWVLTGYICGIITNIIHGAIQINLDPLNYVFGKVDGALGIQGPQIGATLPFIFLYVILVKKKFITDSVENRIINNQIILLIPLVIIISLITDSRMIFVLFVLCLVAYILAFYKRLENVSKSFLLYISIIITTSLITLIIVGIAVNDDSLTYIKWVGNLISSPLTLVKDILNINQDSLYVEFDYKGNQMSGSRGDYGRLVLFIHGLLTPILHPFSILTGYGDYSFFIFAEDSLNKVSQIISKEDFLNTLGYSIGTSTKIIYPRPPSFTSFMLEKGLIFTTLLISYLNNLGSELYKRTGIFTTIFIMIGIFIVLISTNTEDNISLILLCGPGLLAKKTKTDNI